jgi:hypothetical protein
MASRLSDAEDTELAIMRAGLPCLEPYVINTDSAVWGISRIAFRALALARWWHSVTGPDGLRWVSA